MQAFEIIGGILLVLISISMIVIVMLQEGKGKGLGAISGGEAGGSYGKNRAKTLDAILAKYTKICAILFLVVTFAVWLLSIFAK
ncbi:MAG: preprotein translocase subunit SecG [Oscillospiraceae bacterium]|nr:preprotein translocase subunit SecG [Oscillospiraceae bacterium]MDY4191056.1 preprotein translocase subunit SecG [Oscillospiraceae bacterium]